MLVQFMLFILFSETTEQVSDFGALELFIDVITYFRHNYDPMKTFIMSWDPFVVAGYHWFLRFQGVGDN